MNVESNTIQFYDFQTSSVKTLNSSNKARPTAVVPYQGLIFYSDQGDQAIHSANMTTGGNDTILRNNTGTLDSLRLILGYQYLNLFRLLIL